MKVIDLLNKIANGEKVPKKIRVGNSAFELSLVELNGSKHYSGNTESVLNNVLGMDKLNDEVEIVEVEEKEESKPITKESIEALGYACGEIQKYFTNGWNKSLKNEPLIEEDKNIEKLDIAWQNAFDEQVQQDCVKMILNKINEIIKEINKEE